MLSVALSVHFRVVFSRLGSQSRLVGLLCLGCHGNLLASLPDNRNSFWKHGISTMMRAYVFVALVDNHRVIDS